MKNTIADSDFLKLAQTQGEALLDAIAHIASGNTGFEIEIPEGIDVMSDLAVAISFLAEDIADRIKSQNKLLDELEMRVQERTHELENAVKALEKSQKVYIREEWEKHFQFQENEFKNIEWLQSNQFKPAVEKTTLEKTSALVPVNGNGASALTVPINLADNLIGMLGFEGEELENITDDDLSAIEDIAEQVGLALENQRLFNQTQNALAETQELYQISAKLNEAESTKDILDAIVNALKPIGIDFVTLWSIQGHPQDVGSYMEKEQSWTSDGDFHGYPIGHKAKFEDALFFTQVSESHKFVFSSSVLDDPEINFDQDMVLGLNHIGVKSFACLPLVVGSRLIGMFTISWKNEQTFSESDRSRFTAIGTQIATAVDSLRLLDQTQQALNETQALYQISARLNAAESSADIVQAVVNIMDETGLDSARLWFTESTDPSNRWIQIADSWTRIEEKSPRNPGSRFDFFTSPFLTTLLREQKQNALISDVTKEPLLEEDQILSDRLKSIGLKSTAYLPLLIGNRLVGLFVIGWKTPRTFDADDVQRFTTIAAQIATAVDSLQLLDQTQQSLAETQDLYQISAQLNAAESTQDIVKAVVDTMADSGLDSARLWFTQSTDRKNTIIEIIEVWSKDSPETPYDAGFQFDYSNSPFFSDLLQKKRHNALIESVLKDPAIKKDKIMMEGAKSTGLRSVAYMPLLLGNRLVGLFVLGWKKVRTFNQGDQQRFTAIGAQIATAVDSLQLLDQTKQALAETENLYQVSARLNAAESTDDIMSAIVETIDTNPIDSARLWNVKNFKDGSLWLEVAGIWDREASSNASSIGDSFPIGEPSFFSSILKENRDIALIESIKTDPRTKEDPAIRQALEPDGLNRLACLPLFRGSRLIALFGIGWKESKPFEQNDDQRFSTIAAQIATSVNSLRLLDRTRQALSDTEDLYQISARLNAAESTQDIMSAIARIMTDSQTDISRLWLIDTSETGAMWMEIADSWTSEDNSDPHPIGTRLPVSSSPFLTHLLSETKSVAIISSLVNDPRMAEDERLLSTFAQGGLQSAVFMPLLIGSRLFGLFTMAWKTAVAFEESDTQRYTAISAQIATSVDGLRLLDQTQQALSETQGLYQISARLNAAESTADIISAIAETITDYDIHEAILWQTQSLPNNDLRITMIERWPEVPDFDPEDLLFSYDVSEYPFLENLLKENRDVVFVSSFEDDDRTNIDKNYLELMDGIGLKSMIYLPLFTGNRLVGLVTLGWERVNTFSRNDTQRFTAIGAQIATAVDGLQLLDQTQQALNETQALYQISARLNAAESAEGIVQSVVDTIQGREIDGARLWIAHHSNNDKWSIENIHSWFKNKEQDRLPGQTKFNLEGLPYLFKLLVETKEVHLISSIENDIELAKDPDFKEAIKPSGYTSMAFLPLLVSGNLVGLFTLGWNSVQSFTPLEHQYYTAIGAQIATSVEGLRLLEDARQRAEQLEKLTEIETALSAAVDEDEILHSIAKEFPIARGGLHYIDSDQFNVPQSITSVSVFENNQFTNPDFLNAKGDVKGFLANEIWLNKSNAVTHIPNVPQYQGVSDDSKEMITNLGATAFCIIPLRSGQRWQGVMSLSWKDEYELSAYESFLLENLREPLGAIVARRRSQITAQEARQESEQLYNASSDLNQAASNLSDIVEVVATLAKPVGIARTILAFTRADRNNEPIGLEVSAICSHTKAENKIKVGDRYGRSAHEQISEFSEAIFIEDINDSPKLTTGTKRLLDQLTAPAAGILPLIAGDKEVGFMFLLTDEPIQFSEQSRRLLNSLTPQIAVAVQNSLFLDEAQSRADREQVLRQISEKVRNTSDVESVMRTAVTEIGRVLGRKTFLYLKNNDDDTSTHIVK